ncbi:zf-HC2 domain-containing protein [Paenibacillus sp. IHBB 10380]|uniref:zf-HC2 domain-containing protein n=1 Tax=Paenibacillus sp. IHBB 10380 TaxID=1566358 RepID=UPI000695FE5E|nr:zf-HC2 domain-containing protein [Paenibacillus sp. IHBB 10380]
MGQISCEIIKDLLPLYYDEVCSKESAAIVEEHLAACQSCQMDLDSIKATISLPEEVVEQNFKDSNALKGIAISWHRAKLKAFVKGLIGATLVSIAVIGCMVLFQWDIMKVASDVVEITDVSKLSNGSIVYHVKLTDGYGVDRLNYDMDENGNFYVTPLRPIIKTKTKFDIGFQNEYYTLGEIEKKILSRKIWR